MSPPLTALPVDLVFPSDSLVQIPLALVMIQIQVQAAEAKILF